MNKEELTTQQLYYKQQRDLLLVFLIDIIGLSKQKVGEILGISKQAVFIQYQGAKRS